MQAAHIGHQIHGHHLGRKAAVRRHDLQRRTAVRNDFRRLQRGVVAGVVKQQHVFPGFDIAAQNVPGGCHQFVAGLQHLGMRQPAGGDDDHVGVLSQHRDLVGQCVEAECHAAFFAARHAPVNDAHHLAPARAHCRQADLPAGFGCRFQHRHRMATLRTHPRGFQPCGASADDQHFALGRRWRNRMGQGEFAPGGRVVYAISLATGVNAVQAEVAAHAGAYGVFAAFQNLAHDVRVGHVGAGHAHHVELAAGNRVARGVHVLDLGRVEDGHIHMLAQAGGKVQVRRAAHALHWNHIGQACVGINMAADDVQKIHHPGVRQVARNANALQRGDAAGPHLVGHAAHAQNEFRSHAFADRAHHFHRKAHPVFQRAAKGCVQRVGRGRPELVYQMPVGFQLQAVDPGGVHAFGGVGVVADDAVNVPVFHLFGEGAVRGLTLVRGRYHRQPIGLGPAGAPPQVGQLDHHGGAVFMAGVGEFAHPGHDLVFVRQDVVENRRAVARYGGRSGGHGQCNPGLGALHMVGAVLGFGHAVFGVGRLVGRDHQPVFQAQVLELKGLQQWVVGSSAHRRLHAVNQYHWSGMAALVRATNSHSASSTPASMAGAS